MGLAPFEVETDDTMKKSFDICIIGAGASGMAAALEAAEVNPAARILVVEKNDRPGRKIRATGNGRCNISNEKAKNSRQAVQLLEKWGIAIRTLDSGLMYPYSESAGDVADLLTMEMKTRGVSLWTDTFIKEISPRPETSDFLLTVETADSTKRITASKVIAAVGGKAGPRYGTTGDGYKMMRNLGHTVTAPVPILTPVECKGDGCNLIGGTRAKGTVTLKEHRGEDWKKVFEESGEIQFTSFGISGICVFNMTRYMRFKPGRGIDDFRIEVDLCPERNLMEYIADRKVRTPELNVGWLLTSVLKEKLAAYVLARSEIDTAKTIGELTEAECRTICAQVHGLAFHPTGVRGWKEAQCTSGGVVLSELDEKTGESKLCPGLYIAGELQDYDGPCGGYNLNHAWLTGSAAGRDAGGKCRMNGR